MQDCWSAVPTARLRKRILGVALPFCPCTSPETNFKSESPARDTSRPFHFVDLLLSCVTERWVVWTTLVMGRAAALTAPSLVFRRIPPRHQHLTWTCARRSLRSPQYEDPGLSDGRSGQPQGTLSIAYLV